MALKLIGSDEACNVIYQATEKLSRNDVAAANWFTLQISQIIGQTVVSLASELRLPAGDLYSPLQSAR
ncbi:hypothetical protein CVS28_14245 [Arthrobacter glacialis]|nr:hypothetical protein CVS28_14245 [Arthrobacter glacialis]